MKVCLAYSLKDAAGTGIAIELSRLLGASMHPPRYHSDSIVLEGFEQDVVNFEFLDEKLDCTAYIILSRHRSEAGIPCLTVHHTGNPTKSAALGGKPEELSWSFPRLSASILANLNTLVTERNTRSEIEQLEVTYEVTHHGPTGLERPLVFVEIGSSAELWTDPRLHELAALAVYDSVEAFLKDSLPQCKRAAGFGGGHYARRFTELATRGDYCFGHIIPKYAIREGISKRVIEDAIKKNYEGIEVVLLERKAGSKTFRETLREIVEKSRKSLVMI